ncbi:hypothetical protein [Paenibacillus dendritiformis]|nr:hypothetical protein [Paenibacillus dendritiformis]
MRMPGVEVSPNQRSALADWPGRGRDLFRLSELLQICRNPIEGYC